MYQYFDKRPQMQKKYISFYKQFDMFSCMIISFTCDLHLGSQIQSMVNIINQPNNKKN
jgi:hypothetical protein